MDERRDLVDRKELRRRINDRLVDAVAKVLQLRNPFPSESTRKFARSDADAVLAAPAIADALGAMDAARYRLRAEVRWLESQPAAEWATTRQVAMLDVLRLLDGGPWVEREVRMGERGPAKEPTNLTVLKGGKRPATEPVPAYCCDTAGKLVTR